MALILITGAGGFVGSEYSRLLHRSGRQVRAIFRPDSVHSRAPLSGHPGERVQINIGPTTDWAETLRGVEVVVHLAAVAHIGWPMSQSIARSIEETNIGGTVCLAKAAAASGVRRFVFMSSISVNGVLTDNVPFTEDSTPAPRTVYAHSKYAAERELSRISRETGMELVILRPPLIYGPGAPGNFRRLMRGLVRRIPLPLASIDNRRSYVGVENLCDLLMHCLDSQAAAGEMFLVSDGVDISTPEMIGYLAEGLEMPARLFPCPVGLLRFGAHCMGVKNTFNSLCASLQVDSGKLRSRLNWIPPQSTVSGLRQAGRAYRSLMAS